MNGKEHDWCKQATAYPTELFGGESCVARCASDQAGAVPFAKANQVQQVGDLEDVNHKQDKGIIQRTRPVPNPENFVSRFQYGNGARRP